MCESNMYVIDNFHVTAAGALVEAEAVAAHERKFVLQATVVKRGDDRDKGDVKNENEDGSGSDSSDDERGGSNHYHGGGGGAGGGGGSGGSGGGDVALFDNDPRIRVAPEKINVIDATTTASATSTSTSTAGTGTLQPRKVVTHECQRLAYLSVREVYKRRYQLQSIGIELFRDSGATFLLVFDGVARYVFWCACMRCGELWCVLMCFGVFWRVLVCFCMF
jgi:hypothetical protein